MPVGRLKDPARRERLIRNRKAWGKRNPERVQYLHRQNERRLRAAAIRAYGGKCECCAEARPQFLTFDHREGNGAAHRREIGNPRIARWAKANGYPDSLRLLCFNCNCARQFSGFCHEGVPHGS